MPPPTQPPLVDQIKSANEAIRTAATNGGNLLGQAYTAASNGDAETAANLIQQAQGAFAPILAETI